MTTKHTDEERANAMLARAAPDLLVALRDAFKLDVPPYEPPTDPKVVRAALLGRI